MTIYCTGSSGLPARPAGRVPTLMRRVASLGSLILLPAFFAGCDIEWGGARFALVDPSPPPPEPDSAGGAATKEAVPLPAGPLLYAVRAGAEGGGLALPVARLEEDSLASLELPQVLAEGFRERFDSAFAAPGTELALLSGGRRVGSLVLTGPAGAPAEGCPSVTAARFLLLPGQAVPEAAFAVARQVVSVPPRARVVSAPDNRIRTFGPVLAEALLRQAGEPRPYLAQRVALAAVPYAGDARPAMAATYLINDVVEAPPPDGLASSLFYLARFDPARGYVPVWSEYRRYGAGTTKEVFTYAESIPGPAGRIDFVYRHDGSGRVLAASVDAGEERRISWTELPRCASAELFERIVGEAGG
jgi:hypothetical protein